MHAWAVLISRELWIALSIIARVKKQRDLWRESFGRCAIAGVGQPQPVWSTHEIMDSTIYKSGLKIGLEEKSKGTVRRQ